MKHTRTLQTLGAGSLALAAVVTAMSWPTQAADGGGNVDVVNTETVQVLTDATGEIDEMKLFEQLQLTGDGSVEVLNPTVTDGMRDLDGFGGFDTEGNDQVVNEDVDGERTVRSVSDFDGDLPVSIKVAYVLNGEAIEPDDLVGRSGELQVRFTVTNETGKIQPLKVTDETGKKVTKDVEVFVPLVGRLTTNLPSSFHHVTSGSAEVAGDSNGGTRLDFSMTMVPPIGLATAEFGYVAQVDDAVAPAATLSAIPVDPFANSSLGAGAQALQAGQKAGDDLVTVAGVVDANLLKLRDGAGQLLEGLVALRKGSEALRTGLVDAAAPGAEALAEGAGALNEGMVALDDGAHAVATGADALHDGFGAVDDGARAVSDGAGALNKGLGGLDKGAKALSTGSKNLATGTETALQGSKSLREGLGLISGGLGTLSGETGLPAAVQGAAALKKGVDAILVGFGSDKDPASLLGGLVALENGLTALEAGSGSLVGGLQAVAGGLPAAKGGADAVRQGLTIMTAPDGFFDQIDSRVATLGAIPECASNQACITAVGELGFVNAQGKQAVGQMADGLGSVSDGLAVAIAGLNTQIVPGAQQLAAGITASKQGAVALSGGGRALRDGAATVGTGLTSLSSGLEAAVTGVLTLSSGAATAYTGSDSLATGLGAIDTGADALADGAGLLAEGATVARKGSKSLADGAGALASGSSAAREGAGTLADGAGALADGSVAAREGAGALAEGSAALNDGLGAAADGSVALEEGLVAAADGAPALVDGATALSDAGTQGIVKTGKKISAENAEKYAIVEAGAKRANKEKMAVGAPEGAVGLAAYSFEIQGEDGESGRNASRLLAGLLLLGAAGGLTLLRRRKLT